MSQVNFPLRILVAGSTAYTRQMAISLASDPRFQVVAVLTPNPKKVGRKQTLQINPLDQWANDNEVAKFSIEKKLERQLLEKDLVALDLDLILVVDFGYYVPNWLLNLPKIAALNIHPSALPRWRGSAPGQMVLLNGEKQSAITLMKMNSQLDQGDIIWQLAFTIPDHWTTKDYYDQAFALIAPQLAEQISAFVLGKIKPKAQTEQSPTPTAKRLDKNDSFVAWEELQTLIDWSKPSPTMFKPSDKLNITQLEESANALLTQLLNTQATRLEKIQVIDRASRAFTPWPGLWTHLPTTKGEQRLKILATEIIEKAGQNYLLLKRVQLAGKNPSLFNEIKNLVKN